MYRFTEVGTRIAGHWCKCCWTEEDDLKLATGSALGAVMAAGAGAVSASVVVLDFEGVNATFPSGYAQILNFYNGGTSSDGTSGTNYGVSFGPNALALCLNSDTVYCSNTSRGGLAPAAATGALFFLTGDEVVLNSAAGFTTGFSFNYSKINDFPGEIRVYDGLDGTGALLTSFGLARTPSACDPVYFVGYCPFVPVGVAFAGTARSIVFAGVADYVVFDDITFGSATPGVIPEPATWAMMILGFGLMGVAARRRPRGRVVFG